MFWLRGKLFGALEKGNWIKYHTTRRINRDPGLGHCARTLEVSSTERITSLALSSWISDSFICHSAGHFSLYWVLVHSYLAGQRLNQWVISVVIDIYSSIFCSVFEFQIILVQTTFVSLSFIGSVSVNHFGHEEISCSVVQQVRDHHDWHSRLQISVQTSESLRSWLFVQIGLSKNFDRIHDSYWQIESVTDSVNHFSHLMPEMCSSFTEQASDWIGESF